MPIWLWVLTGMALGAIGAVAFLVLLARGAAFVFLGREVTL